MIWILIVASTAFLLICFHNQGVPVMLFHQVNEKSNVKPAELEAYFSWLSANNYNTVTVKEIDRIFQSNKKLPKKTVVLTFDDGYYDNYEIVFPLLKKYNLKAVFFVNTLFIKDKYERTGIIHENSDQVNARLIRQYFKQENTQSNQYVSWEEMRDMEASGLVDIQCHSHRHGMVFSNTQFKGVVDASFISSGEYFVYDGHVQGGEPLFKMRGELTCAGLKIDDEGKKLFHDFYKTLESALIPVKEKKKKCADFFTKDFIQKHIHVYSETEFKTRVEKEITDNSKEINTQLNKKTTGFAWPYGHLSKQSIPWMQALGMQYFFTCKKGTNSRTLKSDFIYRIELRKVTAARLILLTKTNSNLMLGWLYRWVS